MRCRFGNCTSDRAGINKRTKQPYMCCTRHRMYQNNYKKYNRSTPKSVYSFQPLKIMPPLSTSMKVIELEKIITNYHRLFKEFEKVKHKLNTITEAQVLNERHIRDKLAKEVNGKTEHVLPSGDRIDVLTDHIIYEVKTPEQYKSGIGQLTIYHQFFPTHKKVLYITKLASPSKMQYILRDCQSQDIFVQLYSE
jgi:hypothetical protein